MADFQSLIVADIRQETEHAVCVSFDVPKSLAPQFKFLHGQYLTLRTDIDGVEIRRSYSICSGVTDEELRVAIKHVDGGIFWKIWKTIGG